MDVVADGGGVGDETGRSRGVSGISRGRLVGFRGRSVCMIDTGGPLELGGGVIGPLKERVGREI